MFQLPLAFTILVVFCGSFAENSNNGGCPRFQYDHDVMQKIVELEHDHEVMKYLLSRYQQLEDTNIETAKILESQDTVIRSLQTEIQENKRENEAKFDQQNSNIRTNEANIEQTKETMVSIQNEDVRKLKADVMKLAEEIAEQEEKSKLQSGSLNQLHAKVDANAGDIEKLQNETKICSREISSIQTELKDQESAIAELKTKYDNLTAKDKPKPRDCKDILAWDKSVKSGVFKINPPTMKSGLAVYCDMTTQGGGWIVFQRRQDGSEDFYRGWQDYKTGFGHLTSEFWLGLDNIHALVSEGQWELLINMRDDSKGERYALYKTFSVGPESGGYVLTVGDYSGNAGNSLMYHHNGSRFTTKDRDNDRRAGTNCAILYKGGWWYGSCQDANLNGVYGGTGYKGPRWHSFTRADPLEFVEMKIKQKT